MKNLRDEMLADLARSGLDAEDAGKMRLIALPEGKTLTLARRRLPTYKIPYLGLDGRETDFFRLRSLDKDGGFGKERDGRYWQPYDSVPQLYLPPLVDDWRKVARDIGIPLVITEGEKKAAKACKDGIVTAALGGMWNFMSKKRDIILLEDFDHLELVGRHIEIAPDGDWQTNGSVKAAATQLAQRLSERNAEVCIVVLPLGMKLDDFLLKEGRDAYLRLPRDPVNPKAQISFVRERAKLSAHGKKERIAGIAQASLLANGAAHMVGTEPVLFHKTKHRLYSLQAKDDGQLRALMAEEFGINPSEDEYSFVFEQLRGHIVTHGTPTKTALFTHFNREKGVLRLSPGGDWVFKVTASGVTKVRNGGGGVLFRDIAVEPVIPAGKPSSKAFRFVLDVPSFKGGERLTSEQQQMIWELHFWSLLFSSYLPTRPLMLLHGPKGSGKSSAGRAIGMALFGSRFQVLTVDPDNLGDVDVAMIHKPLVVLDNLDGRIKHLENRLATAATGATISKRVLYTTADQAEYPVEARIIATSRQPSVFVRDDVRDRTVFLQIDRRPDFVAEGDLVARIRADRPKFWAYVLKKLPDIVRALTRHKSVPRKERLADFAQFCVAVGPVLGYDIEQVDETLAALELERNQFASGRSQLLQALQYWAAEKWIAAEWKKKPELRTAYQYYSGQLFEEVRAAWKTDWQTRGEFPFNTPNGFGSAIRDDASVLAEYFDIRREPKVSGNKTRLTIRPLYTLERSGNAVSGHGGDDE